MQVSVTLRITFGVLLCTVACCALLAPMGCKSSSSTNPVTPPSSGQTVGPGGGTVASADNAVQLVIPAGALSGNVQVAITPSASACPQGVGMMYTLTPDGQTFAAPATLTIHYNRATTSGATAQSLGVAYREDGSTWFGVTG